MNFEFFLPTKVIFGCGKIKELQKYAKRIGQKAFITTSLKESSLIKNILKFLNDSDINYFLFDLVEANPISTFIDKAVEILKKEKCDYTIGIGGGSSMDFAKAVAIGATHKGSIWDYVYIPYRENKEITQSTLPIIAVTTTSGTGSEVTKWAVVTNPKTYEKSFLESEYIIPKISIVDPELTIGLPKQLTAATGMDALSHAIESYININATPISDITAEESIRIISRFLPEAVANGSNIFAREKMSWANTLAGMTIEHSGTHLVHAMGHVLGGRLNLDHGIAMALCLEPVLKYLWTSNIEKFSKLTSLMGEDTSGLTQKKAAKKSSEVLKELLIEVDLDIKLSDLGVKKEMIDLFVDDAFKYLTPMLNASPKKATKDDIKKLYLSIL